MGPRILPALLAMMLAPAMLAQSDIENVVVETYYITNADDATDTIGNNPGLAAGTRTYRIFLDLCDSCALRALYGDANHVFTVESTAPFFNHNDRGRTYGHDMNNGALDEGTTALDSWLSLGAGSNTKLGIAKADDPDGSIVGGTNNDGGSALIAAGLLSGQDPDAGVPLTTSDGLVPVNGGTAVPPNFFRSGADPDSTFGDSTFTTGFTSTDFRIGCSSPGVKGPTADNRILVGQVTTTGDLHFLLNVEVEKADGSVTRYVATDSLLQPGETANGLLAYPPACGCTDPDYIEYDPLAACDDGSCQTAVVFGCMDPLACNYDPLVNFNIPLLCCYGPDSCNGLDISVICPGVGMGDPFSAGEARAYPNPADDLLFVDAGPMRSLNTMATVHDALGRMIMAPLVLAPEGPTAIDLAGVPAGSYIIRLRNGRDARTIRFIRSRR